MKMSPFSCLFSKTLAFNHCPHPTGAALLLRSSYCSTAHFMAEYLVDSCGFDPVKAAKASNLLTGIKSRHQPDSVLGFFKSCGFDDAEVKKILYWNPRWILVDVEKNLAPKFRAFQDLGFSPTDITRLLRSNPDVVNQKPSTIVRKIHFWRGLLGSNDILLTVLQRGWCILGYSTKNRIQPNVQMLRDFGITDRKLVWILQSSPRIITRKADSLKALISRAEGLGVDRTSGKFHWTLLVLHGVSPERFKARLEFFKGFGWSEADFLAAFKLAPSFMGLSLKNLQSKMEFLINEAGRTSSSIALEPALLMYSLEKRLIPRYQILAALKSRGCPVGDYKLKSYMDCPDRKFLEKYIIRYKECPDLVELWTARLQS